MTKHDTLSKLVSKVKHLHQGFSTFLMLQPFNTVPHAVVTPTIKLFLLLLLTYNFAAVMNCKVNIYVFRWS